MWPWSRSGVMLNARDCVRLGNRDRGLESERDDNADDAIDLEGALRHRRARAKLREVAAILECAGVENGGSEVEFCTASRCSRSS